LAGARARNRSKLLADEGVSEPTDGRVASTIIIQKFFENQMNLARGWHYFMGQRSVLAG